MFQTVAVNIGERISVKDNCLVIQTGDSQQRIPLSDIYAVIIDNQTCSLTVPSIHRLTDCGAHILICNEKHQPVSMILPHNTHYHPLTVIRKQINLSMEMKNSLWDKIVAAKIANQARALRLSGGKPDRVNRLLELSAEVKDGDAGNREGIAAKLFFRNIFGSEFIRMNDDAVNAALNYGYAIIRSAVCKTLCAYGYNCVLGLHHISESNPYNLADDLMEPFRPIVDLWVDENYEELLDSLTKSQRNELATLVNAEMMINGRKMRVRNAIDDCICSLTTAINRNDANYLHLPEIIRQELHYEGENQSASGNGEE